MHDYIINVHGWCQFSYYDIKEKDMWVSIYSFNAAGADASEMLF